ncbi:MAG: ABC transporter permease [Gammaproteobacteria bacterium]
MRIVDTIRLSAQALRRYPLRTSMLVLATAIGVAAVALLTAVGEGARQYVNGQFTSLGTHLLIVLPGKTETSGAGVTGVLMGETPRDLTLKDAMALNRSVHVEKIAPIVLGSGTASWQQRQREITVVGTTSEMLDIQFWKMGLGQFLPSVDMDVATPVCVIGSVVRDEFFGNTNPIAQWLRIGDTRCRISGTLAQAGQTGFLDSDELVILPVANAQQLFNAPGLFRILVQATGPQAINQAKQDIIKIIRSRHQGEEDITVVTQDAVLETFDSILQKITLGLAGIAAISLVVAGILIMNVMLVAVSQRTQEIGVLKALGARKHQILTLFLTEAVCLTALGGLLGLALGNGGAKLLSILTPELNFTVPIWAMAASIGMATTSGLAFSIIPAWHAARLDPVSALAAR